MEPFKSPFFLIDTFLIDTLIPVELITVTKLSLMQIRVYDIIGNPSIMYPTFWECYYSDDLTIMRTTMLVLYLRSPSMINESNLIGNPTIWQTKFPSFL